MVVASPEKLLLKMLWDVRVRNGRPPQVSLQELAVQVRALQQAGVPVYASDEVEDLGASLAADVATLESLGFLRSTDAGKTELTGAGEVLASTLSYPEWVARRINLADAARPG